ncbi:MAG: CaiB/BaiF CoA transferase family protein [Anaerolineales bacterium]
MIDLTRALAGPYCTLMLGDMGARVIKVENPDGGDDTRRWGPPFLQGESTYFLSVNRNKESLTLNLKDARGREILERLLARADVLVENFRPGIMDRLGFGYAEVHERHPGLVYASISGFGQDGPLRERVAYDLILQGMGGLMGMTGEEGGPPVKVGVAITDICAGMFAAFGILAALRVRDRTGAGQWVDAAMLDGQIAWLTSQAGAFFATGENPGRLGSAHPSIVPYQAFRTADRYLNVAVGSEAIWERFTSAIGRPDLASDARFRTNPERVGHRDQLVEILQTIFRAMPTAHWRDLLDQAGVPNGPIYLLSDLFDDPHVKERGMVVEVDHPKVGRLRQTGLPVRLMETPGAIRTAPPLLGGHTDPILGELGYSPDMINGLRKTGVI